MARIVGNARFTALALALAACPVAVLAQSTTTSGLTGTVRDPKGNPLQGALVRITSPVLIGGERSARTSENGSYRLGALPPGTYRIIVESPGLNTLAGSESLTLGQTSTVNFKFPAVAAATIEIIADSYTASTVETSATTNISEEALAAIPVGRDLTQVAGLTPGVTVSDSTSGATARAWGGDGAANSYTIDGLNVGDAKSGEKWVYANPDWFSQISVGGLGAGAEFGGFSGALINGVVKSGGNSMEGSLTAYYQDNSWAALRNNPALAQNQRKLYQGTYSDVTASVGGPILKDKLWYFVSASSISDSATDSPVGINYPVKLNNPRALAKVTWQALPNATWDAFMEYDSVGRDNKYATRYYTHEAAQKQDSPSLLFTTSWTQSVASSVFTLRLSKLNARDDRTSYNPDGYTMEVSGSAGMPAGVTTAAGITDVAFPDLIGRNYWGNTRRTDLLRKNYRGRTTLAGTWDVFGSGWLGASDSHAVRIGFELEQSKNEEQRWIASPNGIAYRTRVRTSGGVLGLRPYRAQTGGGRDVDTKMDRQTVFVQDTWSVNSRLQIRPGLRFEANKGKSASGGSDLWSTTNVAPRLGFTFNVTEDQSQVAKLHLGKYYAGLSSDYFQRAIPGAYKNSNVFYWGSNSNLVNPNNPTLIPVNTTINGPDYYYAYNFNASTIDPNAKMPYTEEVLLGYDVKVGKLWTVGLTAVYRNQKDILVQNDPGWSNPAYVADTLDLVSPISNQPFKAYVTDRKLGDPNNGHSYYITNSSDAKNLYRMLTVSVERALANRWSFYGAMTWAKSEGNYNTTAAQDVNNFNDPNFKFNSYGKLPYVNDKEARVRATYEFPWAWKTRVSGTYTYLSGERYTPLIDLSNNTFELNQNALTVFGTPRGSAKYPSRHLLDIRFSQELNVSSKVKAEAFLDVFNALNECKSYNWNQVAADDAADYGVLGASSGYTQPINVDDPRRLRIGFKLKF
jgi:hypothetical protein